MEFFPYEPFDNNEAQIRVWDWVKDAFRHDEGIAYYRYPIFTKTGRLNREPDVVLFHRELGLWVIECKGLHIGNIRGIQGHSWQMANWVRESEEPIAQAEDEMFALQNKFNLHREVRGKISCHFRVALPFVKRNEWEARNFHTLPTTEGVVLTYNELTPAALRKVLEAGAEGYKMAIDDDIWQFAKGVLGGTLPSKEPRDIPTGTAPDNPLRVIQSIEKNLKILDETQQKIAFEVPDGPQRLRGLAGTGKTVLLAKRAAKMHIVHPDWTIGLVFFTRSLYDQILELINLFYQEMNEQNPDLQGKEPDWTKVKVLHAWGGKTQNGFYYDLARQCGLRPMTVDDVKSRLGKMSPGDAFEYICECLELKSEIIPEIYDALLIDEGQDLPSIFYQLVYASLKSPKRLYWAYDEAQGIGSLVIPNSESIFGRAADGSLLVDVSGSYAGGIQRSHRMSKCYRTPRLLLMTAHAENMGLFRDGGALQGVTNQDDWRALGYEVVNGDFSATSVSAGRSVTITRPDSSSPHPIDQPDFDLNDALGSVLTIKTFRADHEEQDWIADQVAKDLEMGFDPHDIMITALSGDQEKSYFMELKNALKAKGVQGYIAGVDGDQNIFRVGDKVTISNIFRAKGNEAWKVYACRFHYATQPQEWKNENELQKRNEAFVAFTRTRVWCVVTGIESPIFDELRQASEQYPYFTFPAFNQGTLRRVTEDESVNIQQSNWKKNFPDWMESCLS